MKASASYCVCAIFSGAREWSSCRDSLCPSRATQAYLKAASNRMSHEDDGRGTDFSCFLERYPLLSSSNAVKTWDKKWGWGHELVWSTQRLVFGVLDQLNDAGCWTLERCSSEFADKCGNLGSWKAWMTCCVCCQHAPNLVLVLILLYI